MYHGFIKVAAAIPEVRVANPEWNGAQIERLIGEAAERGAEIVCFPELSITGYTCGDLFRQQSLLEAADLALMNIVSNTRGLNIVAIVGLPIAVNSVLYNCAAVIAGGKVVGIVPKSYLPNYNEFYEQRHFGAAPEGDVRMIYVAGSPVPFGARQIFTTSSCTFGIELCEDLWAPLPPSTALALQGAEIIFNLSASNEAVGKQDYLAGLVDQQSARLITGYVLVSAGFGESTSDVVFTGKALVSENGIRLAEGKRFLMKEQIVESEIDLERLKTTRRISTTWAAGVERLGGHCYRLTETGAMFDNKPIELTRHVESRPFVPQGPELDRRCEEILNIQAEGLAKRLRHTGCKTVVVGISGGLDSTLALLVCVRAFDCLGLERANIVGITMPGFGTTGRTYTNATNLMKFVGVTTREISIVDAVNQHFSDLAIDPRRHDTTYENCQARERTQILMDAANQFGGLVVGTGDLSELALGWATYNGDHMSMYNVNASVPKTLVRHLVNWVAEKTDDDNIRRTLLDIISTPISPELLPADETDDITQRTEDLVGPYELHDFFLYNSFRFGFAPSKIFFLARHAFEPDQYSDEEIRRWLLSFYRRFFSQQFKRNCLPDGPKVGTISLSPRGDWRMPSDADAALWIKECEGL